MTSGTDAIPTRSMAGLAALDIFYSEFNDINFYVEDADQENLYHELLRKMFPSVAIDRIFPLGGKQEVIRHATTPGNEQLPAFRAYILDKDFDDLLGAQIEQTNIFYLDRFCIENYLLEEEAIIEVVIESHPKEKRGNVGAKLVLPLAINATFSDLRPLFLSFLCVQQFGLGIKNCGTVPESFCHSTRRWEVDRKAVSRYAATVAKAAQDLGVDPPLADLQSDPRLTAAFAADAHSLVSGKYVASLLFHYVKSKHGMGSITFDSFVFRLAKNCQLTAFDGLCRRVAVQAKRFKRPARRR